MIIRGINKSVVLGIQHGHNCNVRISIDGNIVCKLSEEIVCRKKILQAFFLQ